MSKLAVLQVADAGPLESLVVMLESVGYECCIPNETLRGELKSTFGGKGLVLSPRDLTKSMGYDPVQVPEVGPEAMMRASLYVDVKAHQIAPLVERRWPNLKGKVLWYRINGGKPEHVVNARGDHGNEENPPCPVLTPNQWYSDRPDIAYTCWPPFVRFDEYGLPRRQERWESAVCLIHGINGWGYGALIDNMRRMGVKCHGAPAPDGLLAHRDIPRTLANALCMVHLKSSDAPGYAIYECLAASCPLICTRRLIWRCRMQDLLIPGETCLVFDRETHDGLTDQDVRECTAEVAGHLQRLRNVEENRRIGENGRKRLQEVTWNAGNAADVAGLKEFMRRHFGE